MNNFCYPPKPIYLSPKSDLFKRLDNDKNWIAERKINGKRILIIGEIDGVKLYSRLKILWEVREDSKIRFGTILDGEKEFKSNLIYVFDIPMYEGKRLWHLPLWQRKEILKRLALDPDMRLLPWQEEGKIQFFKDCISRGDEGIVIKRKTGCWRGGFHSSPKISDWLKVKERP